MVRINWTFQAKEDLKSIVDYIARDSKQYAKLQVIKIKQRTHILRTNVYIGKVVQEIDKPNIREVIEGRYRIIYKIVTKNQIDVLTIHHSARDLIRRKIR